MRKDEIKVENYRDLRLFSELVKGASLFVQPYLLRNRGLMDALGIVLNIAGT